MAASSFASPVAAVLSDRISSANRVGDRVGSSNRGLCECPQPGNIDLGIRGDGNDPRLHPHLDRRCPSSVSRGPTLRQAGSPEQLTRPQTVPPSLSSSVPYRKLTLQSRSSVAAASLSLTF